MPRLFFRRNRTGSRAGGQYGNYYEPYYADQAAWGNYATLSGGRAQFVGASKINAGTSDPYNMPHNDDWLADEEDEQRIIEWDVPVNVDAMNKEFMERSVQTWDRIEKDRWLYSFDTEDSIIPDFEKPLDRFKKKSDLEEQLFRDIGEPDDEEDDEEDINLVGTVF